MVIDSLRLYSCKDAELPVICDFAAFSLNRDLDDFSAYSPKFKNGFLETFLSDIEKANDVIEPKSETLVRMASTARLYVALDSLIDPINRLAGYLSYSHETLNISATAFGLTHLRECITSRDAEGAIKELHIVNSNIAKYQDLLMLQGLTEELIAQFISAGSIIAKEKQAQYALLSNRKNIVQSNLGFFNSLYKRLTDILTAGKILYKTKDPVKLQEYTLNYLKKQVRTVSKPVPKKTSDKAKDDDATK